MAAADTQVDTPGKKLLVGIAFLYMAIIVFLPAVNIFYEVRPAGLCSLLCHLEARPLPPLPGRSSIHVVLVGF